MEGEGTSIYTYLQICTFEENGSVAKLLHKKEYLTAEMSHLVLFRGRVIRHVDDHIDFYDDKFVYTFLPENGRLRD